MADNLEDLLRPSLKDAVVIKPMYSVQAHVLTAFFVGPLGFLFFSYYSLHQAGLGRIWRYRYALLFLVLVIVQGTLYYLWAAGSLSAMLGTEIGSREVRYLSQFISLLTMGGLYLLQRDIFNISSLKGEDPPSPWRPAIAAFAIGAALTTLLVTGVLAYVG